MLLQPDSSPTDGVGEAVLESLSARANIYRLISEVFDRLPDADFVKTFREPSVVEPLARLGVDLGLSELSPDHRAASDALRLEFTRLFVAGPGERVGRFGSLYEGARDGVDRATLWSESTAVAARLMKSVGLPPDPEGRIPDHVSVEMRFLSRLLNRRVALIRSGDVAKSDALQVVEQRFLKELVQPWVPTFCTLVERLAELPFYRSIAALTRGFLAKECD